MLRAVWSWGMLLAGRGSHAAQYVGVSIPKGVPLYKSMYALELPCTRRLQQAVGTLSYLCSEDGKQGSASQLPWGRMRDGQSPALLYKEHASTSTRLASCTSFCNPQRVMSLARTRCCSFVAGLSFHLIPPPNQSPTTHPGDKTAFAQRTLPHAINNDVTMVTSPSPLLE